MTWREEARGQRWHMRKDGWRAVVQQAHGRPQWRAAVAPLDGGIGRIAPAVFTSRIAAQAWCISAIRRRHQQEAVPS
jgi:hypothetical protein